MDRAQNPPEDKYDWRTAKLVEKKKVKSKTRGTPDPSRATPATPTPTPVQPERPQVPFRVSQKDMKVWRTVFPSKQEGGCRPKWLNWKAFKLLCATLASVGGLWATVDRGLTSSRQLCGVRQASFCMGHTRGIITTWKHLGTSVCVWPNVVI